MERKFRYIFFDLDGTLLNIDTDLFAANYFKLLAKYLAKFGFTPELSVPAIKQGTYAMMKNNGEKTNETVFWETFEKVSGWDTTKVKGITENFYIEEFDKISEIVKFDENVSIIIKKLKELGYQLVVATNPLFPQIATKKRIEWAGLDTKDFVLYTTFENQSAAKPNLLYYKNLVENLGVLPKDCIMVGNDVDEDMCARDLGFDVFLILDNLINRNQKDISIFNKGSLQDFLKFMEG